MSKKVAVKTMVVGAAAAAVIGVIGVASAQAVPDAPVGDPQDSSQVVSEADPLMAGGGGIDQWLASLNTGSVGGAGAVPPAPTDDNTVIIEQTDVGDDNTIVEPTAQ